MELLLSNYPPMKTKCRTFSDMFYSMVPKSTELDIAVGYITSDSLMELQRIVELNTLKALNLTIGMHYLERFTKVEYNAALKLNDFLTENKCGEVRLVTPFRYHGKLYSYSDEQGAFAGIIGSNNLSSIVEGGTRVYESAVFLDDKNMALKMKVRNIFMEFLSLAKQRCSVRKYKTDEIEKEKLDKILEAARIAPTAANAQSQRLLVISSQEAKEKLSKGVNYHGAPLAIIVCGDHSDVFVRPFDKKDMVSVDATIVADHIVLEAEDLGLSSCWLTYFDPEIIRNEFNIPSNLEPIAIIAVGYADTEKASPDRHSKDRKALESLVCYETF